MCFKGDPTNQFVAGSVAEDELPVSLGGGTTNLSVHVAVAEHPGHTSYVYAPFPANR